MSTIQNEEDFVIDPEMAKVWNDEDDVDFTLLRSETDTEEIEETTDDLEQPEVEDDSPEDSVIDDVDGTEEIEEEEPLEESTEDNSETDETEVQEQTYQIKANGMEFNFSIDELKQLAPKAMDYTKKMQEISPWRKTISALSEKGYGQNEVNLMIDALSGNKEAVSELIKRAGVDTFDLVQSDTTYVPNDYGMSNTAQEIRDIVNQISSDPEYSITETVVDRQWDTASRQMMAENPSMISGLHTDIKSGVYDKVAPIALKLKALDGGRRSDIEYYLDAGQQFYANQAQNAQGQATQVAQQQARQNSIKDMAPRRKAAAPSKTGSSKKGVIDYLNDDDESYDAWYKEVMSKV
jgi:hypothetical protein